MSKIPLNEIIKILLSLERTLTPTMILEVVTAVAELQAGMVAVAGLVAEVLDDGVDGRLLDDAGGVASGAAELRLPTGAARDAGQWHAAGQEEQHGPERHWHRLRHLCFG